VEAPDAGRSRPLLAIVESLAALGASIVVTLGLSLPFLPLATRVEFPLVRTVEAGEARGHDELIARIEALGIAERVEVVLQRGSPHLVLHGVTDEEGIEARIKETLDDAGYRAGTMRSLPFTDTEQLLASPDGLLPGLVIQAGVFLLAGVLLARLRLAPWESPRRAGPWRALAFGAAGGVAAFLAGGAIAVALDLVGLPVQEQAWLEELLARPETVMRLLPWFVVFLPLSEEFFFRGYLFRFLAQRAGFPTGFLVSSALFALVHLNLSGFLVYLAVGCMFALVYSRTASLLAPISAHVVYNGIVLLVGTVLAPHVS
jgi:membrane protease YdiL (CAAX protease family)